MGTGELSVLVAFVVSLSFFILDLLPITVRPGQKAFKNFNQMTAGSLTSAVCLFLLLLGVNFLVFYFLRPALVGPYGGWLTITVFDAVVGFAVFGIYGTIQRRWAVSHAITAVILLWIMLASCQAVFTPASDAGAKKLAGYVNVEYIPKGVYPETDADHIILVPEETARFKARQVISQATGEGSAVLGTIYHPVCCVLQSINGHAYWISELRFNGVRIAKTLDWIVPGYIVVDAEDSNAEPQVKLGYKMKYTPGNFFDNNLHRHIYENGYRHWQIDDLTMEIDDDWQPYFSASLNKPALRFTGSVPKKMIVADPQTGKINEYKLNEIPEFVDRVYSQHVVDDFLDWWGRWSNAPWKLAFETSQNRTKPAGAPVLVYTTSGHPAWQVLMTSRSDADTSVVSVVLFEGRSNSAKIYDISGIAKESDVLKAFRETNKNIRGLAPVHLSMHRIYGELTWVVSYITPSSELGKQAQPFQGVGLVSAYNVQGANVVMEDSKTAALRAYRQLLAGGNPNQAPTENRLTKMAEGNVLEVVSFVISGNTNYRIILDSMPNIVLQGAVGQGENVELPFVKNGKRVNITYLDTGKEVADIISYDDLEMDIRAPQIDAE